MALSNDLIQEFASVMGNAKEKHVDTTCYGKVTRMESSTNGFIQLDGADTETPASFTVAAHPQDRVLAILKNRSALVIGNITHPVIMTGTLYASDAIVVEGYLTTNASRTRYNDTSNNGLTFDSNGIGAYSNLSSWWLKNDGTFQFGGENGITFSDNKVRFGSDVVLTWGSISDKPSNIATTDDIPSGILTTSNYTGTINKTYIDGLNVIAQNISGTTLSGKTISGGEIKIGTPSNNVYPFQVTSAGAMTSTSGKIAGFTINGDKLYTNNHSSYDTNAQGVFIDPNYIALGANGATYIAKDGSFQFGGANGIKYANSKVTLGSDVSISWTSVTDTSNVAVKSDIPTDVNQLSDASGQKWSTTIGENFIKTTSVTAQNLVVKAAKIDGTLTASQINTTGLIAENISGTTLSGKNIYCGTKNSSNVYPFQVTSAGVLTATSGTIGGWSLGTNKLYSGSNTASNTSAGDVTISTADFTRSINGGNKTDLRFAIGANFGVSKSGVLYATSAVLKSADVTGTVTATTFTASETISVTQSGQSNNATLKYTVGTVSNGSGYGWDSSAGWNSGGVIPSGTTSNFTLSVPLYINGKAEINGRLQANGDLDIGNHSFVGRYVYSDYIYATGLRAGSPTGEPQVWAYITGANTKIYMYVNADGRRGLYSTTRGGTSHSILSFADNSTTGTFNGNCTGSSGSCTGNAATATTAASCSGHAASDVPLAGNCTVTGYLYVNNTLRSGYSTLNDNIAVQTENSKHKIGLRILADGTAGLYSYTKDMWLLNMDTNGVVWARTAHAPSTKSMYRIVGSSDTDGIRVGMIRYGNTSGQFDVYAQSGTAGSGFSWRTPSNSDIRLKENIKESSVDSLSVLNRIPLYEFDWKESKKHWSIGFIANYMNEIDPLLAHITTAEDEYSSINTFYMQGHIVKAIQQLTARIEELEKKLKGAA